MSCGGRSNRVSRTLFDQIGSRGSPYHSGRMYVWFAEGVFRNGIRKALHLSALLCYFVSRYIVGKMVPSFLSGHQTGRYSHDLPRGLRALDLRLASIGSYIHTSCSDVGLSQSGRIGSTCVPPRDRSFQTRDVRVDTASDGQTSLAPFFSLRSRHKPSSKTQRPLFGWGSVQNISRSVHTLVSSSAYCRS